jgi:hypothetical protein
MVKKKMRRVVENSINRQREVLYMDRRTWERHLANFPVRIETRLDKWLR